MCICVQSLDSDSKAYDLHGGNDEHMPQLLPALLQRTQQRQLMKMMQKKKKRRRELKSEQR